MARDPQYWMKKGEGHRQRLRDKLQEGGLERFSDEEVIEFLLTLGTPRKDVKSPAREALKKFGTLSEVLSAPLHKLSEVGGDRPQECAVPEPDSSGCRPVPARQSKGEGVFQFIQGCI